MRTLPLLVLSALAAACAFRMKTDEMGPAATGELREQVKGDEILRQYSLGREGKADVFKYFKKAVDPADKNKTIEVLKRKELDLNGDGRIDLWVSYDDAGAVVEQKMDLDFDGKVDVIDHFEKNVVVRKEVFHTFTEKPDEWKFYEKGKLARVERALHHPKADYWEYWEGDHIDRIGEDSDGDGQVDKWTRVKKDE